jgi:Ca2+-binding EF-hand superfamily protein
MGLTKELGKAFDFYDEGGDGRLNYKEFGRILFSPDRK